MDAHTSNLSRRIALVGASAAIFAAILAPRMVSATEAQVATELKKLFGDKPFTDGRIKLDVPQIAENGLVVPVNIEVVQSRFSFQE